jgi:2',3'-cyclic-nucleotide 2'-phosphodiesterase (5'-nucleotidase family)
MLLLGSAACKTARTITGANDDGKLEVVLVQVNDVYEIAPLSGGREGGMARVATLKKQYLQANPNTFLVMAGDFLSPSVYNSLQYEGKAIRGKQMVDAMNAAGMDLVVFGNHEFDIKESELQERINESRFGWVASNAFHKIKDTVLPFAKMPGGTTLPKTVIMTLKDRDGTTAKVGFIGLTLPANRAEYVSYTDAVTTAKDLYNNLKDSVDAVIAITHQLLQEDEQLAKEVPGLAVILGGHEHNMRFVKEGKVYITKAHSNARSAYIVKVVINKKEGSVAVVPELKYINDSIPLDSATDSVVQKWMSIAEKNYSVSGFEARKVVMRDGEPLDALETSVRHHPTNFSRLIVAAIGDAAPADVVLFNSGSIRLDDILQMPVTQYDIIRSLPFGGGIREADMKGVLLTKVLDAGRKNEGIGGYLHYNETVTYDGANNQWKLKNIPIDPAKIYRVAMSEFLLTGKEANLDFLNPANPDVVKVYDAETSVASPKSDVRLAIIRYMEKK